MRTAAVLRDDLFQAKERFDRTVFDRGLTPPERLVRWQAFLIKIEPLGRELAQAERWEARRNARKRARYAELRKAQAAL